MSLLSLLAAPAAHAQSGCDLSLMLNEAGLGGNPVVESIIDGSITLRNEGAFALEVRDASPADGENPDITGLDFYPACGNSTNDSPPTPCNVDEGQSGQPAFVAVDNLTILSTDPTGTCVVGGQERPCYTTCASPVQVRLTDVPGTPPPNPGEKVEFIFTSGLTLPVGQGCDVFFPVQVGGPGVIPPELLIFQQVNTAGLCDGGALNASGSGSAAFLLSNVVADITATLECDESAADFTYPLTVSNPVPPQTPNAGVLVDCTVSAPGASCDGAVLPDISPGQSQTIDCVAGDPEFSAAVVCTIEDQNGEAQAGTLGATAEAECSECDIQLDRQVSCDGGVTWVDAGPGGTASFDDEPVAEICGTTNTGSVKVRWVAVNHSFFGTEPAQLDCNLTDGNPFWAGVVEMASTPPDSVALGGPGPQVIAMTDVSQCSTVEDGEPSGVTALLACDCLDDQGETFDSDEDMDTAGFMCSEPPELEVTKTCESTLDPQTGRFLYTVTVANTAPLGAGPLTNCQVVDSAASDCDTTFGSIAAGDSESITCASEYYTNTATVTCDEVAPKEAAAECPVDVKVDKQVSCDSGVTWHDAGPNGDPRFMDGVIEGCIGWRGATDPAEQVRVRYFAQSTGYIVNCTLFDSNEAFISAAGIAVGNSPNGPIHETALIECNPDQAGWMEPNTATLACECLPDPQLPAEPVSDQDTAEIVCQDGPDLEVTKECRVAVDANSGLFVYDVTIANMAQDPAAAPLTNCSVADTSASGCDVAPGSIGPIGPGEEVTITCQSEYYTNTATVTCEGPKGPDFPIIREASAECPVDVQVDKQVSCDSGATWHDAGPNGDPRFADGVVEGCTGLAGDPEVMVRYFARTQGYLQNCVLTDDNNAFISAAGVAIGHPNELDGMIHETTLLECDESQQGWKEPNTATLTCECLPDPQSPPEPIDDSDTANIDCETCEVRVDKQISCSSGWVFSDVGFDDAVEESCVGWLGQDEIVYRFDVENTGSLPVASCALVDTNETVGAMGVINIGDGLLPGETAAFENPLLECGAALAGGEPDTATYSCSCVGFEDRGPVSDSDSADLECRTADLAVTKTCDPQFQGESPVTITYENVGDASLVNCVVADEIFLDDAECPADVGIPSPIPVSPAGGFDLAPGQSGTSTGVVLGLAEPACNRATVICEIEGALDETGQVKTISATADDLCLPPGEGCYTRTPGFWGTHPRVAEVFLPVNSCGLSLDNVDAMTPGSVVEDVCWGSADFKDNGTSPQQLQLIRQCSAAALNLAVTEAAGGGCESEFPGITQAYQECCTAVCNSAAPGASIGTSGCIEVIDAFNNSADTLECDGGPNALPYPFCPGLGSNGFGGEPETCSEANGNGFINPGRVLGSRARVGTRR